MLSYNAPACYIPARKLCSSLPEPRTKILLHLFFKQLSKDRETDTIKMSYKDSVLISYRCLDSNTVFEVKCNNLIRSHNFPRRKWWKICTTNMTESSPVLISYYCVPTDRLFLPQFSPLTYSRGWSTTTALRSYQLFSSNSTFGGLINHVSCSFYTILLITFNCHI